MRDKFPWSRWTPGQKRHAREVAGNIGDSRMWWKAKNAPSHGSTLSGLRSDEDDILYCQHRISEEENLASEAGSWEAGLVHDQLAMLYRVQLAVLQRGLQSGSASASQPCTVDGAE